MTLYEDGNPEHQFQSHLGDSSLTCCRKQEQFRLYSTPLYQRPFTVSPHKAALGRQVVCVIA